MDNVPTPAPETAEPSPPALPSQEDRLLAILCHVGYVVLPILLPLILFLVKKDSRFVKDNARQALVFQALMGLAWFALMLVSAIASRLTMGLAGLAMLPLFGLLLLAGLILSIVAILKAHAGEVYQYPLTSRLAEQYLGHL
ncbi:MAG TPA: DUF4870 domain-containing protein [Candidatus Nitrosotenuis sp.]|jgi:uncharacterized Tic20 family protein|nr:DUF4870 domain-containing protein [Candidatus Nitrosotenuis sp.]